MTTFSYLCVSTIDQDTEKNKLEILQFANTKKLGNVEFTEEKITSKIHYKERTLGTLLATMIKDDVLIENRPLPQGARRKRLFYLVFSFAYRLIFKHINISRIFRKNRICVYSQTICKIKDFF